MSVEVIALAIAGAVGFAIMGYIIGSSVEFGLLAPYRILRGEVDE
jgi:hypothetical protein